MVDLGLRQLLPDALDYPSALLRCSGGNRPTAVTSKGDVKVLDRPLIGFFCSVRCPGEIVLDTYDLTRALRSTEVTVVGGFQSPMEKECLSLLLRGTVPVVICPARGLDRMRIPAEWKRPGAEGRLLLISFFDNNVHRATKSIAAKRNTYVAALVDRILIAHAEEGGKTERLCSDALSWGKPVFTINSADNAHLLEIGAVPILPNDLAPLTAQKIVTDR